MICTPCRTRADRKKKAGCDTDCGDPGCTCQHKARRKKPEPATGPAGE